MESKLDFFAKLLSHPNGKDKIMRGHSQTMLTVFLDFLYTSSVALRTNDFALKRLYLDKCGLFGNLAIHGM